MSIKNWEKSFWGVEGDWPIKLTTLPPYVSLLSRQRGPEDFEMSKLADFIGSLLTDVSLMYWLLSLPGIFLVLISVRG
jgi:hypothetical protein